MARGRGGKSGYYFSSFHRYNSTPYHLHNQRYHNNFQSLQYQPQNRFSPYAFSRANLEVQPCHFPSGPPAEYVPNSNTAIRSCSKNLATGNLLSENKKVVASSDNVGQVVEECPCFQNPNYFSTKEFTHYIYQYCSVHNANFHYYLVSHEGQSESSSTTTTITSAMIDSDHEKSQEGLASENYRRLRKK